MAVQVKVALKVVPVPKVIIYSQMAGELVANTGMKDQGQVTAIQQAVSEGLICRVIVMGKHSDGRSERWDLKLGAAGPQDKINLQLEEGKSYLEMMDVALAGAVNEAANMIKRLGLKPEFYVDWSDRAKTNPSVIADAIKRLNLKPVPEDKPTPPPVVYEPSYSPSYASAPTPVGYERYQQTVHTYVAPPPPPPAHKYVEVLKISPAKDPDVSFTYTTTRKA